MSDLDIFNTVATAMSTSLQTTAMQDCMEAADDIYAALHAAGFVVVKLPEMVGVNGSDNAVWLDDPYIEQEFGGAVIVSDCLGLNPLVLRKVAAALLAAANKAEED